MNHCERIQDRLDDRIDGYLDEEAAAEVDTHLRECRICRVERAAREARLRAAAALAGVEPARDLWPAIRRTLVSRSAGAAPVGTYRAWAWTATAAAVVLAAALVVALSSRSPEPDRSGPIAGASSAPAPALVLAAFDEAERDYVASRDRFLVELETRRNDLDPDTVRLVVDHLEDMDRSARAIRAALEAEPSDPTLHRLLMASYRKRLGLLRSAGEIRERPTRPEDET